mmetsp:Transcript_34086/g.105454  ORF Transcript_34086/g.105454 Transcript_34086/m.105454 type:complete len:179 (+) Transcript_34086:275-811(+)
MRLTFLCALAAARCAACPGDGNHTTLEDGLIPSKIFSSGAIHTIKHSFPLGSRRTGEIAVESMMSVVLAKDLLPAPVNLADVCHKDMSKASGESFEHICGRKKKEVARYARGPPILPSILVRTRMNPCGLPYRMIDGAHRICRLKEAGATQGCFYVPGGAKTHSASAARLRTGRGDAA